MLSPEQTDALAALVRQRDLARLGACIAAAFPDVPTRLADRYPALIALGAQRAAAHGLPHLLCVARLLACWVALGAEFETRPGFEWAAALLAARDRAPGARVFQLCRRVREQLQAQPLPGRPTVEVFDLALAQLDAALRDAGDVAELGERHAIQIGQACDLDAVDLLLVASAWRQHYVPADGAPGQGRDWRRVPCAPGPGDDAVTVRDAPGAAGASGVVAPEGGAPPAALPAQITVLSHPSGREGQARLRLRTHALACCDPLLHPLIGLTTEAGLRQWRGPLAADLTVALPATAEPVAGVAAEGSPALHPLALATCGMRDSGAPVGELATLLAVYPAEQHLLAWRREAPAAVALPEAQVPAASATRCRLERDGQALDTLRWVTGFKALDAQLAAGLQRLLGAWERESGSTSAGLAAETAVLTGSAGLSWGWAERPGGIATAPFMRVVGAFERVRCELKLALRGRLAWQGSQSALLLLADCKGVLADALTRSAADADLGGVLKPAQLDLRAPFRLELVPMADDGLATLTATAPPSGALLLKAGLRPRLDGPGLQWFAHIATEPVQVALRLSEPLLGQSHFMRPLLPALTLLDWSLG